MLNSFGFNNTSPLVSSDYVLSYLMNNLPSPFFYNEIDNYVDFEINHELSITQEGSIANQNDENNNNNRNYNNDYNTSNSYNNSNLTDDASNKFEVYHNLESNKCEDLNGDMNHHIISKNTKKNVYSSKKDRHSKIWTSNGLRDRRIRLSLEVARPFFDLQDMLGCEKASKTVEWLLLHSSSAIDELIRSKSGCSNNGVAYCAFDAQSMIKEAKKETSKVMKRSLICVKKDGFKQKRKMTTKEDRKKARDKARKRTLEKFQRRGVKDYFVVVTGDCSNQSLNKSKLQAKLL